MATSTFDRKIEITDMESFKKLLDVIASDAPTKPLSEHPFTGAERDRSDTLLKQLLSRSKH